MPSPPETPTNELPLVSVVVPTFNRTRYLTKALESALAQTYPRIEILVSDDASQEDMFAAVVSRFGDPRIKYHRNPTNLGMGQNTWNALVRAGGKYVATLHDDDEWEPDFVEALVPPLERDDSLSIAFSDHWVIDEDSVVDVAATDMNTRRWHRDQFQRGTIRPFLEAAMVLRVVPAAMAALFRKTAIDWNDFSPEIGTFYDGWLAYLSARTGAAAHYEPRRLSRYRVHRKSETLSWASGAGRLRALRQAEFVGRRYLQDAALADIRPVMERDYITAVWSLAAALVELGDGVEAISLLQRANDLVPRTTFRMMEMVTRLLPTAAQRQLGRAARRVRSLVSAGR
jgi:glycosyltransferase involved in cell wall biosynthesis